MKNSFDRARAAENTSRDAIEFLEKASQMNALTASLVSGDMKFSDAFMLFTRLSLLITRRRPEIAVHCVLIHVLPHIADVKVREINRVLVNQLVNPLILEGKIVMGRRVFSLMKQFLGWCAFQGVIDTSPLNDMSLNKVAGGAKPVPRERKLTDAEVWVFWNVWDYFSVCEGTKWAARLCLVAARRPDEVLRARVQEFDLKRDVWNQGTRNKSARQHSLPLSPLMRQCVEALIEYGKGSQWLVPSNKKRGEDSPMSKVAIAQALRRILERPELTEVEPFTPRDLRRTARSYFPALGINQEVARKIMNHSLEGIDQVYDRHDYMDQMRDALNSFSAYIASIVEQIDLDEIDHKFKGDRLSTELIRINFSQ
ncbi:site-specific integrase (plasmid) [Citrobacter sp. RHB20-C16]|uniref:Integrase n=2 Tax=Citrobacter amalonaticus TaxID=35703 RepID=A0ABY0HUV0_CITAM|nr:MULTISPECIES: site-specific integrase [Citrobacter]MZK91460.1 tyrosine-type recombinase/integrase [Citrobacter amalonaticus]MZK96015.1 tyrosine-type recombinase/integrase [Citrobacter amalonaticus]MZL05716.1 tyrosine-type recombinase/integrase [Citrobacter amalonaticus]MZL25785.1 tyrosine-type recombinase/integrase [Citrobacter amalonaticus]MZL43657.1 tyrosine-type recombinase/integrase [Citrobacter amalonaticus]